MAASEVAGSNEVTQPPWADRLRELLLPVLRHQIERSGMDQTGAYNFYGVRVRTGQIFMDYEIELTRKLLACNLGIRQVHEIGCGFGQLMFLLGWNGFQTVGFEADRLRGRTAQLLRTILNLVDPALTDNVQVLEMEFPSDALGPPEPQSLVLTTNLVATCSVPQQLATLAEMKKYPYVLTDVQRFFDHRPNRADESAALALFAQAGYATPELFLDLNASGRYYLFRNVN